MAPPTLTRLMNLYAVWKLNLPQRRTRVPHLPADRLTTLAPQGTSPLHCVGGFHTGQIKRWWQPGVMRIADNHGGVSDDLRFQLGDAPCELILHALGFRQPVFHALRDVL